MPYLPSDAEKKSKHYDNIINGDILEYQDNIEDLKKQQQISSSVDANSPLRDEDGVLISFESSTPGISLEEEFEEVRLENRQWFFDKDIDNSFTYYFQPLPEEESTEESTKTATKKQIDFQMRNRDYLIQVINVYFGEENEPSMSTDLLHDKLNKFFNEEGKKGGKNVNGWEEFRGNKNRKVLKFRKKGKKKRPGAGRSHNRNYRSLKKQMDKYQYDNVINRQLYYTLRGQEIWMELGFPFVYKD